MFSNVFVNNNLVFIIIFYGFMYLFFLIFLIYILNLMIINLLFVDIVYDVIIFINNYIVYVILLGIVFILVVCLIFLYLWLVWCFLSRLMGSGRDLHLFLLFVNMLLIYYCGWQLIKELNPYNHLNQYDNK